MRKGMSQSRDNPPSHGPGCDAPVFDEETHLWTFPLNERGRGFVEGYLKKYGDWPLAPVKKMSPRVYRAALQIFGAEEADAMARHYVTRAAGRYDPEAAGCSEDGYTYIINGLYMKIKREVTCFMEKADGPHEVQTATRGDGGDDTLNHIESREKTPDEVVERVTQADVIRKLLAFLSPRDRKVLVAYYQGGLNFCEIGRRMGLSNSRIQQITSSALATMRRAAADHPTLKTLMDQLDPERSSECPRNEQPASRSCPPAPPSPRPSPPSPSELVARKRRSRKSRDTTSCSF